MFHCIDCGIDFDEPAQWQESRGEYWGTPAYETCYSCPFCQGDFEEKENEEIEDEC